MTKNRSRSSHRSGQMLIISVLLVFTLLVIVPAMIYFSRTNSLHGIFSMKSTKGRLVAEEGVALALQQLSKPGQPPPNWPYFPVGAPTGALPAPGTIVSPQGTSFLVTYSSISTAAGAQGLQPYQVGVLVRALDTKGQPIGASSVFALVSQRTSGAKLATGFAASAALELMKVPLEGSDATLRVEWGPIVLRDTNTWNMDAFNQKSQRPRKFSAGGIWPRNVSSFGRTSDQKEFWTFASPGFATVLDTGAYIVAAQASACPNPPTGCVPASVCAAQPAGSCYFPFVGSNNAVFDTGFTMTSAGGTIYVNGNATFNRVTINTTGAVIVMHDLTLGLNGQPTGGLTQTTLRLPPTVAKEDPYCSCCDMLCTGKVDRHLDISGYVYTAGNLTVAPMSNWTIYGVTRIDGQLNLGSTTTLYLFYNDLLNHTIKTSNFEVQIDSMTAVP